MILFIFMLMFCIIVLVISLILVFKTYKRKRDYKRKNLEDYNRANDNRSMFMSAIGVIFSVIVMLYTLLNAIPKPIIYPLNNESKIYSESAQVIIDTHPLIKTYYSLDGSDPKYGYVYDGAFTVTKTTTVSAKNKFLFGGWSELSQSTFRFENTQNITVNSTNSENTSIQDIFTYALIFLIFCAIFVPTIRGDK